MTKLSKLLGGVNLFFTGFMLFTLLVFLFDNNDGTALAVGFASVVLIIVAIILSIPFLFILKKKGYKDNKFYVLSHLSLLLSSILSLLAATALS